MRRVGWRKQRWPTVALCAAMSLLCLGTAKDAAAREQQQSQSGQSDDQAASNGASSGQNTTNQNNATEQAKPARAKHVITNDDIKPSPYANFGGLFYFSTGSINDCDSACSDQVRAMATFNSDKNPNWRTQVLRELEQVRSNSEWQTYLRALYGAHNKICQLTFDKQDELRRSGNSRNVGPTEIAIAEKYEDQTKAAQNELNTEVARQSVEQKKFAEKPYANAFASLQGTRMMGGFCSQAKVIYPTIVYR